MKRLRNSVPEEQQTRAERSRFPAKAKIIAAALPLAASLLAGCPEVANECRVYNESTVAINRQTDGRSAGVKELEGIPFGPSLTEPMIDFINETHALSTEGMPDDVKMTLVPQQCFSNEGNRAPKGGFAVQESDDEGQRGIYFPEGAATDPIHLIEKVNHEIGHLQQGNPQNGAEAISQLNEYEQKTDGFALLAGQGADTGELSRWLWHDKRSLFYRLADIIESGRGQPGNEGLDSYDRANIFIFQRLQELDGDFGAIRREVTQLVLDGTLQGALDDSADAFLAAGLAAPDVFIRVRMAQLSEIDRRFGMASAYFEAYSRLLDRDLASGLDGLNCAYVSMPAAVTYRACSDSTCGDIGADASATVDYSLCCLGAGSGTDFTKWRVDARGTRYRKNGGTVTLYGFGWDSATYLAPARAQIGLDESCI